MPRTLVLLSSLAVGCGGAAAPDAGGLDASGVAADAAPDGATLALADLTVTIAYEGELAGSLGVGAFPDNPPMGAPLAFQTVAEPSFPATVTLRDLEPGDVFVFAVLDVAPASPTVPGPEDGTGSAGPVAMDGSDAEAMVTVLDPEQD